ncbi:hypothetical protein HNP36_003633 [Chryseobacterium shigense]|uniref:Uncharacterized protein n=1 Tax=Chryseobacterium shigense TaxID=297244 RepID=A0A841N7F6_9FLAO|nr:hypothetical protein [Chryseobacterium shigense]
MYFLYITLLKPLFVLVSCKCGKLLQLKLSQLVFTPFKIVSFFRTLSLVLYKKPALIECEYVSDVNAKNTRS